ncbi:excisionase [Halothiobacillus sp.]|uniref:excisionase n=1 Tax=Halothiobacillus sp. TaxID=1891311 RepID=UPI002AD2D717|nr:excisionase [Halothiobacillus sp.]
MAKLITLEQWLARTFEEPPAMDTARRWCRDGKIQPAPKKIGRSFFLQPDAEHVQNDRPTNRLIDRIRAETSPPKRR